MCLYSYRDDLTKRLLKITAQVRKKSTSGSRASLKNVAALNSLAQTKTTCMRFFPTFQTLKK